MSKLKIGMIGAGFIGQLAHLMNFIEVANCEVCALAEYKPELRSKVASRFGIPKTYATHLELLQDHDIDAVVVVTPRAFTGPVVFDCLKAGKHVLSEKPMVGNSTQGKLLLDTATAKKVKYAVGYMKRYDEGINLAKEALDEILTSNSLGPILSVHATCFMGNSYCNPYGHVVTQEVVHYPIEGWGIAPDWLPASEQTAFGAYLNTYTHVTNLLRYLFNEIPSVQFVNLTQHSGQVVVLGFSSFLATLHTGKMSHHGWSEEITISFADGEIKIFMPPALLRNVPAKVQIYRGGQVKEEKQLFANWSWAFKRQAEGFVNDILEQKPMRISGEEAYQDLLLTESIWRAELGRKSITDTQEVRAITA